MPALDNCHQQVVNALIKDGWYVYEMPRYMDLESRTIFIDLEATKAINGSQKRLLLAEIKCFQDENRSSQDIYQAIGQYLIYRTILKASNESEFLYLAIPTDAYERNFDTIVKRTIEEIGMMLLIVNLETEQIEQWLE